MYTAWKMGDRIRICAKVDDFCGQQEQFLFLPSGDMQKEADPCSITCRRPDCAYDCIDTHGREVVFTAAGTYINSNRDVKCSNLRAQKVYRELGRATSDTANGIATLIHTVTEQDMNDYNDALANGYTYDILCCMNDPLADSSGALVFPGITVSPPSVEYTHTLKLFMRPWGWYTPQGAADEIITKMNDINGQLFNYLTPATGYSYVRTEIATEGEYVVLSIRLKASGIQMMTPIAPWIIAVVSIVAAVIILIGLIASFSFKKEGEPTPKQSEPVPPAEQKPGVGTTDITATGNCKTLLPASPTCQDIAVYATCLDSVHTGIYGTLMSVYPNFNEFRGTYEKYLGLYSRKAAECNASVPGKTPNDMLNDFSRTREEYKNTLNENYDKLQRLYESQHDCWIGNPTPIGGGCLLTAGTGKVIVGTLIGVAVIGGLYWAVTRRPKETKIFIEQTKEVARKTGEAAKAEYARAKYAYQQIRAPVVPKTAVRRV